MPGLRDRKEARPVRIRLKSFCHFDVAEAFGSDRLELSTDDATVRTLLEEVAQKGGGVIRAIDPQSGMLDTEYFVLVNGREVQSLPHGLETQLKEGDEIGIGTNYFWGGG